MQAAKYVSKSRGWMQPLDWPQDALCGTVESGITYKRCTYAGIAMQHRSCYHLTSAMDEPRIHRKERTVRTFYGVLSVLGITLCGCASNERSELPPPRTADLSASFVGVADNNQACSAFRRGELVVRVRNDGSLGVPETELAIRVGSGTMNTTTAPVPGLLAGQSVEVSQSEWADPSPSPPGGDFNVVITIDARDDVDEDDETNNELTFHCID